MHLDANKVDVNVVYNPKLQLRLTFKVQFTGTEQGINPHITHCMLINNIGRSNLKEHRVDHFSGDANFTIN